MFYLLIKAYGLRHLSCSLKGNSLHLSFARRKLMPMIQVSATVKSEATTLVTFFTYWLIGRAVSDPINRNVLVLLTFAKKIGRVIPLFPRVPTSKKSNLSNRAQDFYSATRYSGALAFLDNVGNQLPTTGCFLFISSWTLIKSFTR